MNRNPQTTGQNQGRRNPELFIEVLIKSTSCKFLKRT